MRESCFVLKVQQWTMRKLWSSGVKVRTSKKCCRNSWGMMWLNIWGYSLKINQLSRQIDQWYFEHFRYYTSKVTEDYRSKRSPPLQLCFLSLPAAELEMAAAFRRLGGASTWMPDWPHLLTFDLTGEPTPVTWVTCCPTALTPCLDRLPASQNSGDMAGQVSEELSKTKSQISHTLYQSNILEAQSRSQFRQKSRWLQRWRGLRVPPPPLHTSSFWRQDCCRSAEELPFVATWHKARMLAGLADWIINKR